jgi:hypothetical protein
MAETFICKCCREQKLKNIRLKGNQEYCNSIKCQRARKNEWHKRKTAQDQQYREQQHDCLIDWRKNRPLDQYQRKYRQEHLDYVQQNREQQRQRNRKHYALLDLAKIVKMDASASNKSSSYFMGPTSIQMPGIIANMDALFVQLTILQKHAP